MWRRESAPSTTRPWVSHVREQRPAWTCCRRRATRRSLSRIENGSVILVVSWQCEPRSGQTASKVELLTTNAGARCGQCLVPLTICLAALLPVDATDMVKCASSREASNDPHFFEVRDVTADVGIRGRMHKRGFSMIRYLES
jgi:hypothetical protein